MLAGITCISFDTFGAKRGRHLLNVEFELKGREDKISSSVLIDIAFERVVAGRMLGLQPKAAFTGR